MSGQLPIDPDQNVAPSAMPWSAARLWAWRGALGLYLALLLWRALQIRNAAFEPVHWAFNNEGQVVAWFGSLVWHELVVFVHSFLLGLLLPPALGPSVAAANRQRRWLKFAACCGFGLLTIFLCFAISRSEAPPVGSLVLPFVAYLLGLHLGSAAMRGVRPAAFAIGQLALMIVLMVGATVGVAYMAVSSAPLKFDSPDMSTDDKRALAQRIRDTRPPEGEPRIVHLADAEINALVNSVLSRGAIQHRGSVHFEPEKITALASFALPPQIAQGKFLNVQLTGNASIDKGRLKLSLHSLRLGSIDVPRPFVAMLSSFMFALLEDDPELRRITDSVDKMTTEQGAVNFVFESDSISRQVVPSLVQLLWKQPDVAAETRLYLQNLLFVYRTLPADADRFGWLVHAAFAMAAERSQEHDPLLENRAALLALAILMGHEDLEIFVGEVLDGDGRAQVGRIMNTVELRGRHDLARHFLVSAALTLLSRDSISDRIGVLKEELDSQEGGSGFSFVDLLADFAGTRFANMATQNESTARALQTQLLQKFDVDAYFPPFDGLPEDIPAAELQSKYGGVDGAGYQQIIEEINRRLSALPKL